MATVSLKPHLVTELYDVLFPRAYQVSVIHLEFFGPFDEFYGDRYHNNSSDSGPYNSYDDTYPPRVYTYRRIPTQRLLKLALQNKFSFRRFLSFLNDNFTLRFRKQLSYLHHSDPSITFHRGQALGSKRDRYIRFFYKYAGKVSFYKVELGTEAAINSFVRRLGSLIDLRHIDMTGKHEISPEVLPKLANVFAKLTDFDVDADTFVLILEKTTASFPHLERLKINGEGGNVNKIVASSERFPVLKDIEMIPEKFTLKAKELAFAENAFPTVQNFSFTIEENSMNTFTVSDFELIKNWFKKFPSLKKAKIAIKRWVGDYPLEDREHEKRLHTAFRSFDFGGAFLDISFHAESSTDWPEEGVLEERFACFEYVDVYRSAYCNHKDSMPGKKFEHHVNITLEY